MSSSRRKPQDNTRPVIAPGAVDDGVGLGSSAGGTQDRDFGSHGGLLDTADPYAGQGVRVPEERMFGAQAREGWIETPQGRIIRSVQMNLGAQTYALREQNRELLLELSQVVGHEGDDFQNPYVWQGRGVFPYDEWGSHLAAGQFGDRKGAHLDEIALNVRATAGIMAV